MKLGSTRGSKDAVGYDLCAAEPKYIQPLGKALISTDLSFSIPLGHYGRIAPRSGMSENTLILVLELLIQITGVMSK